MGITESLKQWLSEGRSTIGQVRIQSSADQPDLYILCHVEDIDIHQNDLELYSDAEVAFDIAKFDENNNFRPLHAAPNLKRGWNLQLCSIDEVRLAIDLFYPGRLGAYLAYRNGTAKPIPMRETLDRQTGMYRITQKLTADQADDLIAATCHSGPGGCMRTILWTWSAACTDNENTRPPSAKLPRSKFDFKLDQPDERLVPRIPLLCLEACNFLVAAARPVVKQASAEVV